MALMDGLIVLGVFGSFAYIIYARLVNRNSPLLIKGKQMFNKKPKPENKISEHYEQIYPEKRRIM